MHVDTVCSSNLWILSTYVTTTFCKKYLHKHPMESIFGNTAWEGSETLRT